MRSAKVPAPRHPGRVLRDLRVAAGLTQRELAALAGIGHKVVYEAEVGRRNPRELTRERLARALGVSRHDIWPEEAA